MIRRGDAGILTQPCFCLCAVCNYLFKNEHSANPLIPDILVLGWSNKQIKSYLHITNEFWKQTEIIPSDSLVPVGVEEDSRSPVFRACGAELGDWLSLSFLAGYTWVQKLTCNSVWKKNFCGHCEQS